MHRSGTSAVTNLLRGLGYFCGSELLPPQADNPRGYFEDRRIVEIHDRFLLSHRLTWSDPRPLPEGCFEGPEAEAARRDLHAVLESEFLPQPRWVVKDPRMCRLMPLWQGASTFGDEGPEPPCLFVLRSPAAVAASIRAREGLSLTRGIQLWLRHTLESERATRERPRGWLRFESLVDGSLDVLASSLERLGIPRDASDPGTETTHREGFDPELVHHTASTGDAPGPWRHPWVLRTVEALDTLVDGDAAAGIQELDAIHSEIARADEMFFGDREVWESDLHGGRYALLGERVEQTNRQIEHIRHALDHSTPTPPTVDLRPEPEPLLPRLEALQRVVTQTADASHRHGEAQTRALADRLVPLQTQIREIAVLLDRRLPQLESDAKSRGEQAAEQRDELHRELRQLVRSLDERDRTSTRLAEQLEGAQAENEVTRARLDELRLALAEKEGSEQSLRRQLAEAATAAEETVIASDELRRRLEEVTSAATWRLTRPLRRLGRWLGRTPDDD